MHIPQCIHTTLHSEESPEASKSLCSHAGTVSLKEVSPASSEEMGREKRRKLHGTLESWAEEAEKEPQCKWGVGVGVGKPHKTMRLALVAAVCRAQGEDRVCSGEQCCSVCVVQQLWNSGRWEGRRCSQSMTPLGKGMVVPFLFCFVSLFFLKGRELLYRRCFYCGAKVAVVQAGWNHSLEKVAICAIPLVQPYKIRPSNSSQSEDRKRETKLKYVLL